MHAVSPCGEVSSDWSPFKRTLYRKMIVWEDGSVWILFCFALFCLMFIQVFPPILITYLEEKSQQVAKNLFKTVCQKCFGFRI